MLKVAKKTFGDITVGFVVGYAFYPRSYGYGWNRNRGSEGRSFRSIRHGLMFPTVEKAEEFRDSVENQVKVSGVKFEEIS